MGDLATDEAFPATAAADQHASVVDGGPSPTMRWARMTARLVVGAVICLVAPLATPASAAEPSSRVSEECTPMSPRFAESWETFEQQARGRVTRKFGTVRWSDDRVVYTIKAGYLVEFCVITETVDGDMDYTGGRVLGPEKGVEDDLASMERMPITVLGFGYSKARPSDGLPATGPRFGWTTPLAGCGLGLLGLALLRWRPKDATQRRPRPS